MIYIMFLSKYTSDVYEKSPIDYNTIDYGCAVSQYLVKNNKIILDNGSEITLEDFAKKYNLKEPAYNKPRIYNEDSIYSSALFTPVIKVVFGGLVVIIVILSVVYYIKNSKKRKS